MLLFFYQTEMLLISNLLILSILLMKGSCRLVPAGNPQPQESQLRPGKDHLASTPRWVSRVEPGQGLEEVGDNFKGTGVLQHLQDVLRYERGHMTPHGQDQGHRLALKAMVGGTGRRK